MKHYTGAGPAGFGLHQVSHTQICI